MHPVAIASKKITITRPRTLPVFSVPTAQPAAALAISNLSNARSAESINNYLRWESFRARTDPAEAARIKTLVRDADAAIGISTITEELVLYRVAGREQAHAILNTSRFADDGFLTCTFDPSVAYHASDKTGRDQDGYLNLLVMRQKNGDHLLYINESAREILLPRAMTWELVGAENINTLAFTLESVPRYQNDELKNIRLLYMTPGS
ncbi:MAG: hypothetical protein GYA23_07060 [Methanomicrobiales archaeon]|nr:hypothetical protein [Methanomicrobiales archaeon]